MAASTWHWDLEPEDLAYEVSTEEVDGITVYFCTNPYKEGYCKMWAVDDKLGSRDPKAFGNQIARKMKNMGFREIVHEPYHTWTAKADWRHTIAFAKKVNAAIKAEFENQSVYMAVNTEWTVVDRNYGYRPGSGSLQIVKNADGKFAIGYDAAELAEGGQPDYFVKYCDSMEECYDYAKSEGYK